MKTNYHIDNVDLKILNILSKNAKMPYTEVAKKIFVSGGTVHVRMKKLEKMGIVKGTRLQIDYNKLGYKMTIFMGIYLEKSYLYKDAVRALKIIPEVIELHAITGQYTIFAKILCKDTIHLREVLDTKIHKVKGITRTESFLSIEETFKEVLSLNNK
jgi:Lrp/AsnC family transcriptional regulator for asnA, asnC and gidA